MTPSDKARECCKLAERDCKDREESMRYWREDSRSIMREKYEEEARVGLWIAQAHLRYCAALRQQTEQER